MPVSDDISEHLTAQQVLSHSPAVYKGFEHQEISIPLSALLHDGKLNLFEEVIGRNYFQVQLSKSELRLRAGGSIGLIALNEEVWLDIEPRVPIRNLERMLLASEGYVPDLLESQVRRYGSGPTATPAVLDMLASRLLELLDELRYEGMHFAYTLRTTTSQAPVGRIKAYESSQLRWRSGQPFATVSSTYQRTHDTAPNRCLKMAILKLIKLYSGLRRKGARDFVSRLNQALASFQTVSTDVALTCLAAAELRDLSLIPDQRSTYPPALTLAIIILKDGGIAVRTKVGEVILPSILISMEQVFERYARSVLQRSVVPAGVHSVLDGNKAEGLKPLFADAHGSVASSKATPDVVVTERQNSRPLIVFDAKYKRCEDRPPDREDINQVVVYGLTYATSHVGLIYPSRGTSEAVITPLGKIGPITVVKLAIDLGAEDMDAEEASFTTAVTNLLQAS